MPLADLAPLQPYQVPLNLRRGYEYLYGKPADEKQQEADLALLQARANTELVLSHEGAGALYDGINSQLRPGVIDIFHRDYAGNLLFSPESLNRLDQLPAVVAASNQAKEDAERSKSVVQMVNQFVLENPAGAIGLLVGAYFLAKHVRKGLR